MTGGLSHAMPGNSGHKEPGPRPLNLGRCMEYCDRALAVLCMQYEVLPMHIGGNTASFFCLEIPPDTVKGAFLHLFGFKDVSFLLVHEEGPFRRSLEDYCEASGLPNAPLYCGVTKKCPNCGGRDILPFLWGLPTDEGLRKGKAGEAVICGCVMIGNEPEFRCKSCGYEWRAWA
jgi:hypothetical protein